MVRPLLLLDLQGYVIEAFVNYKAPKTFQVGQLPQKSYLLSPCARGKH